MVALAAFVVELTLSSVGVQEYFGSFFFWLDLLSTVSIITDIEPLMLGIISLFSSNDETADPVQIYVQNIISEQIRAQSSAFAASVDRSMQDLVSSYYGSSVGGGSMD